MRMENERGFPYIKKAWVLLYIFAALFLAVCTVCDRTGGGCHCDELYELQYDADTVFVWLDNYAVLLSGDNIFIKSVVNTLTMALVVGPVSYIGSLLLAWLLNELPPKIRTLMVFLIYVPSISGNAFVIWQLLFSGDQFGYINSFLLQFGFINGPIQFLKDTEYMMPVIIIVTAWMSMGTQFLSFVAGLQGMDAALYEAGAIDGIRSRWQELWYITLPQLKPQLMFGAVMSITGAFTVGTVGAAALRQSQYRLCGTHDGQSYAGLCHDAV